MLTFGHEVATECPMSRHRHLVVLNVHDTLKESGCRRGRPPDGGHREQSLLTGLL